MQRLHKIFTGIALSLCATLGTKALAEDPTFQSGVRAFNNRDYNIAINYFTAAQKDSPYDSRAFYYEALCRQRLNQSAAAQTAFQRVINSFPDSEAAEKSKLALAGYNAAYTATKSGGSLTAVHKMRTDFIPDKLTVKAKEVNGMPQIEVKIAGKPIKVLLDPARQDSTLGVDALKEASIIDLPGFSEKSEGHYAPYDLKIDNIERNGFVFFVSKAEPKIAILGTDFFNSIAMKWDKEKESVTLLRDTRFKDSLAQGIQAFNKHQYKVALPLLKRATLDLPKDPRALYLYAVCLDHMQSKESAKGVYRQVIKRFPGTEAQFLAQTALAGMDPAYARELADLRNPRQAQLPGGPAANQKTESFEIPYTPENGHLKVSADVDNAKLDMWFEPRETTCVFSREQLAAVSNDYVINLNPTVTEPNANMVVTSTAPFVLKRVTLGKITRFNLPGMVFSYYHPNFQAAAWGSTDRPTLAGSIAVGWKVEVLQNVRRIRFTKLNPGQADFAL